MAIQKVLALVSSYTLTKRFAYLNPSSNNALDYLSRVKTWPWLSGGSDVADENDSSGHGLELMLSREDSFIDRGMKETLGLMTWGTHNYSYF